MLSTDDWYKTINKATDDLEVRLGSNEAKGYRLPYLLKLAEKVAAFSATCPKCQSLKLVISHLTADIGIATDSRQTFKNYKRSINDITVHLKKQHRLVTEKQYLKRFFSISASLSLLLIFLGIYLVNFGITLLVLGITLPFSLVRIAFSSVAGYFLDRRARKQGRVI